MRTAITAAALSLGLFAAPVLRADCVNRFTKRSEGTRHHVTFLTGKLTFQSAQELAEAIRAGKSGPLEWLDQSGRSIAKQFGDLKVVRPMPVGCDGNSSGVIMIAVFPSAQPPERKMIVKLDANNTVAFDEQN